MQQLSIFDNLLPLQAIPFVTVEPTPVVQAVEQVCAPKRKTDFFQLDESILSPLSSPGRKAEANLAAIETVLALKGRKPTDEQRRTMAAFTGWGGLSTVFAPNTSMPKVQARLKELLSEFEYAQAQDSVLTAYYTEPVVSKGMWKMLRSAGFDGGKAVEMSCGAGHIVGAMPVDLREKTTIQMVEIEPITAKLASAIYSDENTNVRWSGIEDISSVSSFDVAITNVPFGSHTVSDRRLNKLRLPIHEYFVAKALDMIRPGGLAVLIVPASLMDKEHSKLRPYMLQRARLIEAVRLPSGAFDRLGGTNVLTDIIMLQKRDVAIELEDLEENHDDTALLVRQPVSSAIDHSAPTWSIPKVNAWFASGTKVLGKFTSQSSQYGKTLGVLQHSDWAQKLSDIAASVPAVYDSTRNVGTPSAGAVTRDPTGLKSVVSFGFFFSEDGRLMKVDEKNGVEPQDNLSPTAILRLEGMTRIRDCVLRTLEADAGGRAHANETRQELNALYDAFVSRFGFLLSRENRRLFRADSHAPLLWSLERWDDENEVAIKADIFNGSTVSTAVLAERADTIEDAIALSYNKHGCLKLQSIESAMQVEVDEVVDQLKSANRLFMDPATGEWTDSLDYLSGNVRLKLKAAKAAAEINEALEVNVQALQPLLPEWIAFDSIAVRLGVPWISSSIIERWLTDVLELNKYSADGAYSGLSVVHVPESASWCVTCGLEKMSIFKTDWGTNRKNFWDILRALLNQQTPEVHDEIEVEGRSKRVINRDETLAVQEKAEAITKSFLDWLNAHTDVRLSLEDEYNTRYNGTINRSYDGSHLQIPGLNPQIKLRDAQKDSIWRGIVGGNTLYALAVGGGKTLIQICLAQESKRLGLANKPILVVPNHMLEAFAGEYLRAFPRAKVLAASKDDFAGEARKTILMRAATGNWDCIIVTHSTFGRIGLAPQTVRRFAEDVKEQARESVLGISDKNVVREASRAAKVVQTKLDSLLDDKRDEGVLGFEELGIDMILVDEADLYKNLFFFTKKKRIPGIAGAFSSRALDLMIKSRVVFKRRGSFSHGLVFSTATPISNSIAEMFIMQTYLQEDRLKELEIDNFDAWSANFAREVTCVEVKPEGSGYRMHTRFARFVNVPELMLVFREIAEIRTKKMLGLPEPKLFGGAHEVVAVEPSQAQKDYVQTLVERAASIRAGLVTPDVDNMLCVTSDGRKAALDMRCINPSLKDDPNSKVNVCASRVFEIWESTKEQRLTQLVFCDLGVPGSKGFSVYEQIRCELLKRGVPADEIAFAQEWSTDAAKAKLHRMVRVGKIRVLIGSTELMGFGTNVQDRLIAKHDLDAPWRPRDVEQRDGRIIRQGNQNEVVHIIRYVTAGTFDAYMWQTLERKAAFIAQVMENNGQARSVEDVTSQALSYAEVKALACGNPIVIEKAAVDSEVAKLQAIKAVFDRDVLKNARDAQYQREYRESLVDQESKISAWLQSAQWSNENPLVRGAPVIGQSVGEAIMKASHQVSELTKGNKNWDQQERFDLLKAGNVVMYFDVRGKNKTLRITCPEHDEKVSFNIESMPYGADKINEWLANNGPIAAVNEQLATTQSRLVKAQSEEQVLLAAASRVFEHAQRLEDALCRQAEIDDELEVETDDKSAMALEDAQ
jgi:N12 class adenine-specific DNA methylase